MRSPSLPPRSVTQPTLSNPIPTSGPSPKRRRFTRVAETAFVPPYGFRAALAKSSSGPPPAMLPSNLHACDVPTLALMFPILYALAWSGLPCLYTDGACLPQDAGPNLLGAAFYDPSTDQTHLVNPNGEAGTNTITRAELAAICAALMYSLALPLPQKSLTLFTDSLASLYLIQRILRRPDTLRECKHALLLRVIAMLIMRRAHAHLRTAICKVKAHSGQSGNERADGGAADALASPALCTYVMSHSENQYMLTLPAWPCLPPRSVPAVTSTPTLMGPTAPPASPVFLGDLTSAINSHVLTTCPATCAGASSHGHYTTLQESIHSTAEPSVSNWLWSTASCPWRMIKTVLAVRYGTLWTASRALMMNLPYITASSRNVDGLCPVCRSAPDTPGHILGACPALTAYHISRHNKAVCFIQDAVKNGSMGGCFTIMDATSLTDLPDDVADTRIPSWMLPGLDPTIRARLRPDLLLVQGLSVSDVVSHNLSDPVVLSRFQRTCTVHILEVGYTSDASYLTSLSRKHFQHVTLCRALVAAGWKLSIQHSSPFHILLLGMTGIIFKPCSDILLALGISKSSSLILMRKLHVHAVQFADSIIRLRRRLEWTFPSDTQPP